MSSTEDLGASYVQENPGAGSPQLRMDVVIWVSFVGVGTLTIATRMDVLRYMPQPLLPQPSWDFLTVDSGV